MSTSTSSSEQVQANASQTDDAAKKKADSLECIRIKNLDDPDAMRESVKRVGQQYEQLTGHSMKVCISEIIQTECCTNPEFARLALNPRKSMGRCFRYVTRRAREYLMNEVDDATAPLDESGNHVMCCGDVPDELCFAWAREYFRDEGAPEDEDAQWPPRPSYTTRAQVALAKNKTAKQPQAASSAEKTAPDHTAPAPVAPAKAAPSCEQVSLFGGDSAESKPQEAKEA